MNNKLALVEEPKCTNVRDAVDTALLLDDLKRRYKGAGGPLNVTFRELASWVRAGDQFTHQIHPYPAKLLPHIANFFIRASSLCRPGQAVLDPFCGSGTVALEASLAGACPIVADANPFALLLTRVKTTPYAIEELVQGASSLRRRISRLRTAPEVEIVNQHLWYSSKTKKSLEIILRAINAIEQEENRDFFKVCFSVVARRLSYADPAVSVPVRIKQKSSFSALANAKVLQHLNWLENASAIEEFDRAIQLNIGRVHSANLANPNRVRATFAGKDARNLLDIEAGRLPGGSVRLSITSPPYGSAQKYVRASSLALNWLSLCSPTDLAKLESQSIGREHLRDKVCQSAHSNGQWGSTFLDATVEKIYRNNPLRGAITETYLRELRGALVEIARVTSAGGHAVIIIGNNTVTGLDVANDIFISEAMQVLGFTLELSLFDRIHSRGLMTNRNKSASLIAREAVLLFRKRA